MSTVFLEAPRRLVDVTIDGATVRVPEGATLLDACRQQGIDTPTLCYLENLTPVNVCRVCVVEVEGSRTLVPACSRKAESGMTVRTDSDRVRTSRRMVLEFLASSADMTLAAPEVRRWIEQYGADPGRYGPAAPPHSAGERDAARPGEHHPADGAQADTVAQPVKYDNDSYVRDYSRCILCYKCVEACGEVAQNTFAIAVAGRGFDARISTEFDVGLPDSACVYCGNCIGVCPTGALMFKSEHDMRQAGSWDESKQTVTTTICPYCGVDAQNTFAIGVAGRGFDAHISTEFDAPLPDSACVYCGNCIGVCPTGALMFKSEHDMRQDGTWDESRQTVTTTICPYCGVGCNLELHVQDNRIVKVTSPLDHDVGNGHLCVKGRFGFEFVQRRDRES